MTIKSTQKNIIEYIPQGSKVVYFTYIEDRDADLNRYTFPIKKVLGIGTLFCKNKHTYEIITLNKQLIEVSKKNVFLKVDKEYMREYHTS